MEKENQPVDSHCHLDFEQFNEDRKEIIEKINDQLEFVVNAGVNLDHNSKTLELAENKSVHPALGLHPVYTDSFDQLPEIKKQIKENQPVAVGEIGLDHHHITEPREQEKQKEVFKELVELAEELELPVVVHSREAEKEAYNILKEAQTSVFLHCFNGKPSLAKKAASKGMKIGVTTQVLYSDRVQNIVKELKLEDILLETDSPYLYRGERNKPLNVEESAEKIADIKDTTVKEVVRKTTENAEKFYLK